MSTVPEGLSPIVNIRGTDRYRPPMEEVRGLAWNLGGMVSRSSFEIKYLVGITRGGLSVADCVSRSLDLKDIQTLAVELYKPGGKADENPETPEKEIKIFRRPKLPKNGNGALFVDDVLDTGTTMTYVREQWPNAATAVVYTKKLHDATLEEVSFYGRYVGNVWVDFPWEVEAQMREDLKDTAPGIIF